MAFELTYPLGIGIKLTYVLTTNNAGTGVTDATMATGAAVDDMLGVEDVRSRIEPATEANANLLPAIDDIKPREIKPITEMRYINTIMF